MEELKSKTTIAINDINVKLSKINRNWENKK